MPAPPLHRTIAHRAPKTSLRALVDACVTRAVRSLCALIRPPYCVAVAIPTVACSNRLPNHSPLSLFTVFTISLIFKRQITNPNRRRLFRCDAAFENEITAYASIVPVLQRISPYDDGV